MPAHTITPPPLQASIGSIPADLRAWLSEGTLVYLALEAVQSVSCPARGEMAARVRERGSTDPMLLTLLTYCYAVALYSSSDIEAHTRLDETVRYLCARSFPDWNLLRAYRRRNRDAVRACLEHLIAAAWQLRQEQVASDFCNAEGPSLGFAAEALARIDRAVQADSMAMDE